MGRASPGREQGTTGHKCLGKTGKGSSSSGGACSLEAKLIERGEIKRHDTWTWSGAAGHSRTRMLWLADCAGGARPYDDGDGPVRDTGGCLLCTSTMMRRLHVYRNSAVSEHDSSPRPPRRPSTQRNENPATDRLRRLPENAFVLAKCQVCRPMHGTGALVTGVILGFHLRACVRVRTRETYWRGRMTHPPQRGWTWGTRKPAQTKALPWWMVGGAKSVSSWVKTGIIWTRNREAMMDTWSTWHVQDELISRVELRPDNNTHVGEPRRWMPPMMRVRPNSCVRRIAATDLDEQRITPFFMHFKLT
jgi:hypothetical protein